MGEVIKPLLSEEPPKSPTAAGPHRRLNSPHRHPVRSKERHPSGDAAQKEMGSEMGSADRGCDLLATPQRMARGRGVCEEELHRRLLDRLGEADHID
ncbi:hypothetical protein Rxyl_2033 [Rubrobacter xylanophilus DSM 9941]|uniref:Uncharacterized protein n=1 Tax=Rubrobacter xylanophilus (strain DSM 9941 / JCM 11954 / NBRC 16129 / PRD-1) TaxID=266117 RepID=Q1AUE8_RUBXD|nr:hypothetical protein Rxyl_2033 [Rubrobacter xylanophilus DSM 9941]